MGARGEGGQNKGEDEGRNRRPTRAKKDKKACGHTQTIKCAWKQVTLSCQVQVPFRQMARGRTRSNSPLRSRPRLVWSIGRARAAGGACGHASCWSWCGRWRQGRERRRRRRRTRSCLNVAWGGRRTAGRTTLWQHSFGV
jgi:hypothetical protein